MSFLIFVITRNKYRNKLDSGKRNKNTILRLTPKFCHLTIKYSRWNKNK